MEHCQQATANITNLVIAVISQIFEKICSKRNKKLTSPMHGGVSSRRYYEVILTFLSVLAA